MNNTSFLVLDSFYISMYCFHNWGRVNWLTFYNKKHKVNCGTFLFQIFSWDGRKMVVSHGNINLNNMEK